MPFAYCMYSYAYCNITSWDYKLIIKYCQTVTRMEIAILTNILRVENTTNSNKLLCMRDHWCCTCRSVNLWGRKTTCKYFVMTFHSYHSDDTAHLNVETSWPQKCDYITLETPLCFASDPLPWLWNSTGQKISLRLSYFSILIQFIFVFKWKESQCSMFSKAMH